ncbi:MAG: radical SAM protein [Pseudomonadota bacterium]|nr:radical SAM protein [Pseudomonadota bacterium]
MIERYLDNVVWELTLRCNARCLHCGSAAGQDREDNLTVEEMLRVCDELAQAECRKVTLIGGETFLHPAWRDIVSRLHQNNIEISIVTNGFLLNEERIKFLAENGVTTVGLSLDGTTAEKHDTIRNFPGMFKRIFDLGQYFEQYNLLAVAITTVTSLNILELQGFIPLLKDSFFSAWQLQIGSPYGRMSEDLSLSSLEYYVTGMLLACYQRRIPQSQLEIVGMHDFGYYSDVIPNSVNVYNDNWHGCPAGRYVMGIRSNGKVVGCLSVYNDDYIDGDLRKKTLKEIWDDENICTWNNRVERSKKLTGHCKDCPYAFACCAGCSSICDSYTKTVHENPLCYYAIESKYKNCTGTDTYSCVLRDLTNSKITEDGRIMFANNKYLDIDYVAGIPDDHIKELLKQLI